MSETAETEQAGEEVKDDKKESDEDILKEARERRQACVDAESENRDNGLDDLRFLTGGLNQWDAVSAQVRTAERRPILTINNLPTFLHQITNEHRMQKMGGKVSPVDDGADEETAEVIQGMIRHIEYDSDATTATTTAVNSAAAIGWGWFRLVTEYEAPDSFNQKIMFKRVRNALSVHIDPLSQEVDGSDMKFAFVDSLEPKKEFQKKYPKASASNNDLVGQEMYQGWIMEDTVLVCEYYRIKTEPAKVCLLSDGTSGWKDELPKPLPLGVTIKKERDSGRKVVEWFKITGADVLERTVIKADWIPVFPVYGDEIDIEGRVVRSGVIRNAKDPFRMYNFFITSATEEVALRPKSPFIMAEGQDEGHPEWNSANQRSFSKLVYKPTTVDGLLVPPPQRQAMADIPSGMLAMAMHASDNKKATTGLFDSSLGARGSASSGIQEREQQQQGDMANMHYSDNLKTTYRHALRCLVSMLPHYYDAARTVRILGEDETSEVVQINQPIERQNPKTKAIEQVTHDLSIGEYDVTVQAGPAYSTKRQEAAEFMTDAIQAAKDPAAASVLTYLAIKNHDVPGGDEAVKMLKKLLPPGVAEPEEGEEQVINTPKGPMPVSQVGELLGQMDQALQQAGQEMQKGEVAKSEASLLAEQNKAEELRIKGFEAQTERDEAVAKAATDKVNADTAKIKAEADLANAEADALRAQTEAGQAGAAVLPLVEQVAAAVAASRQVMPTGMAIRAPSGAVYDVTLQ